MPPPAAAPFTGFMCCPAPGPVAGPPGIIDPIIPVAPGSPGCPPPSMLASFPISVSAQETGGRWRKQPGQIGGAAVRSLCCLLVSGIKMNGCIKRGGRENSESELSVAPPSPPSSSSSSAPSASVPVSCLLTWWRERAARPRRQCVGGGAILD